MAHPIDLLCAEVESRRPCDARERTSISAFVAAARGLAHPYEEHADPTHVTASALLIGDRGVVLHRHKRLGLWLQPGGHIDPGEHPADAALREAREETGLPVELAGRGVVHVDVHPGPRGHTHLDVRYLVDAAPVDPSPPEGESQDVGWFTWREAIAVAEPGVEGALRALQPGEPTLRRAAVDDAHGAAHVHLRSRLFATPVIPNLHDEDDLTQWITRRIADDEVWVADVDGVVVAEMILSRPASAADPGHLDHLYLDPAWMGRGLGDRLLELADDRLGGSIDLWTHEVNAGARRFYERHGFTVVERTDGAGNEERLADVRYVRRR
jgi:8-oxo-dGTP pyrophosphatase MutT (NUDIX family)/GNAT superfamily N-acetyltransferase